MYSGLGLTSQQLTSTIGGALMSSAPYTGPAAPFVAGAGLLTSLIGSFFKPDLTKIEATNIVDRIEAEFLKPNLAMWDSLVPSQKTASAQQAALANFDAAWNAVLQGCGNPQLGNAGVACIADRSPGGKYPWRVYFRDPIANDPDVQPDPVSALFGGAGSDSSNLPLLAIAALVALAVAS